MKVCLIGPMTGLPDYNYPAFHAEAARLRGLGFEVVSPAELFGPPPAPGLARPHEVYMRASLKALLDCDAIHCLPGWYNSKGACIEYQVAMALNMEGIYRDITKQRA